jgi:hypothetical protein
MRRKIFNEFPTFFVPCHTTPYCHGIGALIKHINYSN